MSSLPNTKTRPQRIGRQIETVRVGERVRVDLRGRQAHRSNGYLGRVADVGFRAFRLGVEAERFDWWWSARADQVVVPWGRIEAVHVRGAA